MKRRKGRAGRIIPIVLTAAVMGVIFLFSSQRAEQSNAVSMFVTERIVGVLPQNRDLKASEREAAAKQWNGRIRKYAHVTVFFALGIVAALWLLRQKITWKRYFLALLFCLLYAAFDELHQMFVGGRGPMLQDVGIDFFGSLLGSAAAAVWMRYRGVFKEQGGGKKETVLIPAAAWEQEERGRVVRREKISVIVPVYRVEPYLCRCVESILCQSYRELEIILVDDGSPDSCGEICDRYEKQDPRVRVIHQANGGLSSARNTGIAAAEGAYLAFVDSDDYLAPDMLQCLYESIQAQQADLAVCGFCVVDEMGKAITGEFLTSIQEGVLTGGEALERLADFQGWCYVTAWNKLYRRELFQTIHFPAGKLHEDEFVAHRIFALCSRIACVDKPLYYYVQRRNSITGDTFRLGNLDAAEAYLDRIAFAQEKGMGRLASRSFIKGMRILTKGYLCLDLGNPGIRERIRELRDGYYKIYTKKCFSVGGYKKRAAYFLFFQCPAVYRLLRKFKERLGRSLG